MGIVKEAETSYDVYLEKVKRKKQDKVITMTQVRNMYSMVLSTMDDLTVEKVEYLRMRIIYMGAKDRNTDTFINEMKIAARLDNISKNKDNLEEKMFEFKTYMEAIVVFVKCNDFKYK